MLAAQRPLSVVLAGGGTAGHIEPALAVGQALRDLGVRVSALGTTKGLEGELVPSRGFELRMIDPVPVPRKLSAELCKLPLRVIRAVRQAYQVLDEVAADAVIGFGGYVSAPAYLAARVKGIPIFVHEANAKAGMANKLGAKLGARVFSAGPDSGLGGEVVGIPIRANLSSDPAGAAAQRGQTKWGLAANRPCLLVTGGSQGARTLNEALAGALNEIVEAGIQVLHAYGKKNPKPADHEHYTAVPFIEDMAAAYGVADLIVCRSGAMTVAEVSAAGIPAIYVPLPHGNGEQGLNAAPVVAAGAARLIADADLTSQRLSEEVVGLFADSVSYQELKTNAGRQVDNNAAIIIARAIVADLTAS